MDLDTDLKQIPNAKVAIAVFISNAKSDHEIKFKIKHTIKHNFLLKLGKSYAC